MGFNRQILVFFLLFTVKASADIFNCRFLYNLDVVQTSDVLTEHKEKVKVFDLAEGVSYITQIGPEQYSLELFVSEIDTRIYSEASVTKDNSISAIVWSRQSLVEVNCKRKK